MSEADTPTADTTAADRVDRRLELIATVIMAAATVASAWCAYQSSRWSGIQSIEFAQASALRVESSKADSRYGQLVSIDLSLFESFLDAFAAGEDELAEFYEERFREPFKVAFDAWIATEPRTNPDAPKSPFAMDEYQLPEEGEAARLVEEAETATAAAKEANQRSDNYVLAVVLFASCLFMAGISTRLDQVLSRRLLLVFAILVMMGTGIWVAQMPVTVSI